MALPPLGIPYDDAAIFTDLYQLSMLQSYYREGMEGEAVFTLFFRKLPETRNYMLAAGLDPVLEYLETLHFSGEALAYLESTGRFEAAFLDQLTGFRFTGSVRAVAEGTPVFPHAPILEIAAPIAEAQLIETLLINQITVSTILASKAARVVEAAKGRPVIDFGTRRAHGFDAGNKAARSAYIAGCVSTANVLAGKLYDLPIAGTMAHSYVEAWKDEYEAFRHFVSLYPETVLLIDTYDPIQGVENVIRLSRELGDGFRVRAVRLDSGDLAELSKEVRRRLDAAGLNAVEIVVSGGLDEYRVADLIAADAPINGFGVGTRLTTSSDAAELDIAYKLAAYDGEGRMKLSPLRKNLPGAKQVARVEEDGTAVRDIVCRDTETGFGRPLLETVMIDGERTDAGRRSLDQMRETARTEIARLPAPLRELAPAETPYAVVVSDELTRYTDAIETELSAKT
ncbi:nicotinate phosphoribosyltransferase [Amorphus orientalis]|uniref:Nicotinate phosphoribosyltransferase n=1 Tax=Amorphus orientalis TaxID=649198 RepID=A0AAE4AS81_9HYPH|nr:nicotinate phosphoribosyltransferase [Amorphus orientalis]MDQ0314745.1 nicotinate phosphoribosyltransferase [Amorphus orientalis]